MILAFCGAFKPRCQRGAAFKHGKWRAEHRK
jgi:hypothetical protein